MWLKVGWGPTITLKIESLQVNLMARFTRNITLLSPVLALRPHARPEPPDLFQEVVMLQDIDEGPVSHPLGECQHEFHVHGIEVVFLTITNMISMASPAVLSSWPPDLRLDALVCSNVFMAILNPNLPKQTSKAAEHTGDVLKPERL